MNKKQLKYIIIIFIFGIVSCSSENNNMPIAKQGIIDYTAYKIQNSTVLNGEWIFYQNELINCYKEVKKIDTKYIEVPNYFIDFFKDSTNTQGFGYGTYQLVIKGLEKEKDYTLKLNTIGTSSAIFVSLVYPLWKTSTPSPRLTRSSKEMP